MERKEPRRYYFADIYALDCRYKDSEDVLDSLQERVRLVGKFLVCPTARNDVFFEVSTSKRMGSIDLTKLAYMNWRDGFDYPNLFVDKNSLKKASKEEIVRYKTSQSSSQNELIFIRNTILNGCVPANKFFYKASIKHLKDGYDEEFKKPLAIRNLDAYLEDYGSYIFTDMDDLPFVEILTGMPFSAYFSKTSHNQWGVPFIKLLRDICVKGHDTLLVDEDNRIKLLGEDLFKEFNKYCLQNPEELREYFLSKEQEIKSREDSSDSKGSFTMKPSIKKEEKE